MAVNAIDKSGELNCGSRLGRSCCLSKVRPWFVSLSINQSLSVTASFRFGRYSIGQLFLSASCHGIDHPLRSSESHSNVH